MGSPAPHRYLIMHVTHIITMTQFDDGTWDLYSHPMNDRPAHRKPARLLAAVQAAEVKRAVGSLLATLEPKAGSRPS